MISCLRAMPAGNSFATGEELIFTFDEGYALAGVESMDYQKTLLLQKSLKV